MAQSVWSRSLPRRGQGPEKAGGLNRFWSSPNLDGQLLHLEPLEAEI